MGQEEIKKRIHSIKLIYKQFLIELEQLHEKQMNIIHQMIQELEEEKKEELKKLINQ